MEKNDRIELIKKLEEIRGSRIISYVAGDRKGFETRIASDVVPLFYEHLKSIGKVPNLDLFLYSVGGITIASWQIINLLREFCDKLSIIIPYKAKSTATLITLGADEILMGPMAELSPVDPSVTTPFNPKPEGAPFPSQFLSVNVEDVVSYINLAREKSGLTSSEDLVKVFEKLVEKIHPLALGNVYRARTQIKLISKKLLQLHLPQDDPRIDKIVDMLTEKLFSHDYPINRIEAKKIGLSNIIDIDSDLEELMWELFETYREWLKLDSPFDPDRFLGDDKEKTLDIDRAIIETSYSAHYFHTKKIFRRIEQQIQPPIPGASMVVQSIFQERVLFEGWQKRS